MNGATADPCASTISVPRSKSTMMIGANQNFLRSFINAHKSFSNSIIRTVSLRDL